MIALSLDFCGANCGLVTNLEPVSVGLIVNQETQVEGYDGCGIITPTLGLWTNKLFLLKIFKLSFKIFDLLPAEFNLILHFWDNIKWKLLWV